MKIMYFLAHPWTVSGAINTLLSQASIIQEKGYEIRVILQDDENGEHIPEYDKLCERYELKTESMIFSIATCLEEVNIIQSLNDYGKLYALISEFAPDIIHSLQINTTVELVARELNIPHLMNVYQMEKDMMKMDWIDILPKYHSCDSEYYSRKWASNRTISKCIRTWYETKNMKEAQKIIKDKPIEIINVAEFAEHKRQLEILKFIKMCKDEKIPVHMTFLGAANNQYAEKCRQYIRDNHLEQEVAIEGIVLNVDDYYAKANVLIHASTAESYPVVIIEAMANRLPIIATPVAGIPELLIDKKNGFLTEGFLSYDLFSSFQKYMEYMKNEQVDQLVEEAYQTYLTNHTKEIVQNRIEDYYQLIISDHNLKKEIDCNFLHSKLDEAINAVQKYSLETQNKVWYLHHINCRLKQNNLSKIMVWGAGFYGEKALEWCDYLNGEMLGFIDKSKEGTYHGYVINNPDEVCYDDIDTILVAVMNLDACQEIGRFLEKKGFVRNYNYFFLCNNPCMMI